MKKLIRITYGNGTNKETNWIFAGSKEMLVLINNFLANFKPLNPETAMFDIGKVPFHELPENIQQEVKQTLKAYNRCGVTYANGHFCASTGTYICTHYAADHFSCGDYYAKDLYTEEERRQNYFESFGSWPVHI